MKFFYFFLLLLIFTSCKQSKSGIEREEFYQSGNLKSVSYFNYNNELDSIYDFLDTKKINVFKKRYYDKFNDSIKYVEYDSTWGYAKGYLDFKNRHIGVNKIYYPNGVVRRVSEYFIIDDKQYLNQARFYDKDGGLIPNKGNFFEMKISKKEFLANERIIIKAAVLKPLFSNKSKFRMVLYKGENLLKKDFSEIDLKKADTINVLKNNNLDGIFLFSFLRKDKGVIYLKGKIIEEYEDGERNIYFNRKLIVK